MRNLPIVHLFGKRYMQLLDENGVPHFQKVDDRGNAESRERLAGLKRKGQLNEDPGDWLYLAASERAVSLSIKQLFRSPLGLPKEDLAYGEGGLASALSWLDKK